MANIPFSHAPVFSSDNARLRQVGAAASLVLMAIVAGALGVAGAIATFGF
jgi:hypothetical protein